MTPILDELASSYSEGEDVACLMEKLLNSLGADSRACRATKTIHQDMVLHSTFLLKTTITEHYMTKDIREDRGWVIALYIMPIFGGGEQIDVCHIRREQSVDKQGDTTNHWEFEWEIRMSFNKEIRKLHAAKIKVLFVECADTMEEDFKETLLFDLEGAYL